MKHSFLQFCLFSFAALTYLVCQDHWSAFWFGFTGALFWTALVLDLQRRAATKGT